MGGPGAPARGGRKEEAKARDPPSRGRTQTTYKVIDKTGTTTVVTVIIDGPPLEGAELASRINMADKGKREGVGVSQLARDPDPFHGEATTNKGGKSPERKKDNKSRKQRRAKARELRKAAAEPPPPNGRGGGATAPAPVARPPPAVRAAMTTPASQVQVQVRQPLRHPNPPTSRGTAC